MKFIGLCNGREDVYDRNGVIGYSSSIRFSYLEGLSCQRILHGKSGNPVSLNFSHINISKGLDYLAIYDSKRQRIANFSGLYSGSDLQQMNLTGKVMIALATPTDKEEGWSASFYIASPVNRGEKNYGCQFVITIVGSAAVARSVSIALVTLAILKRRRMLKSFGDSVEGLTLIKGDRAVSGNLTVVAVKARRYMASQTKLEEEILLKSSSHLNIVTLLGYPQDGLQRRCLVFEFMQRGSLRWNLREKGGPLDWEKRLAIGLQIDSANQMVCMYSKPPIYHGNITSDNILLDELCNAKLAGFGAANYCSGGSNRRNCEKTSEMAEDVWGFGILLVENL